MNRIRIVLADDHLIVRQGLRAMFEQEKDILVVADANDGRALMDLVEIHRPQVALVDLKMPNLGGLEAAEQIHHRFPGTQVVILSMYTDRAYIERAMQAGALGYVFKEEDFSEITTAIRKAAGGIRHLSRAVLSRNPDIEDSSPNHPGVQVELTVREREILQLIAEGNTSLQAGEILKISPRTVEEHRRHIRKKFNLVTRMDFYRFALEHGLLQEE